MGAEFGYPGGQLLARRTGGSPTRDRIGHPNAGQNIVRPAPWMLVDGGRLDPDVLDARPRGHRSLLVAVARRGLPNLIEATVIPAVMFFVIVKTISAPAAMAAVLIWAYTAILRRVVRGTKIPAILL